MSDDDQITLNISIPVDTDQCLRSLCPNCGLDFKQSVADDLLHDVVEWSIGQVLRSSGAAAGTSDAVAAPGSAVHCPYCGHSADRPEFLHPEHVAYIHSIVMREVVEPMMSRMLASAFGGNRRNSFIQITHSRGPRPPRPLIGPEAGDLVRVRCLTCNAVFKVLDFWRGGVCCPECSTSLLTM